MAVSTEKFRTSFYRYRASWNNYIRKTKRFVIKFMRTRHVPTHREQERMRCIKRLNSDEIARVNIEWREQHTKITRERENNNSVCWIEIFESAVHVDKGNESIFLSYFRVRDDGKHSLAPRTKWIFQKPSTNRSDEKRKEMKKTNRRQLFSIYRPFSIAFTAFFQSSQI